MKPDLMQFPPTVGGIVRTPLTRSPFLENASIRISGLYCGAGVRFALSQQDRALLLGLHVQLVFLYGMELPRQDERLFLSPILAVLSQIDCRAMCGPDAEAHIDAWI